MPRRQTGPTLDTLMNTPFGVVAFGVGVSGTDEPDALVVTHSVTTARAAVPVHMVIEQAWLAEVAIRVVGSRARPTVRFFLESDLAGDPEPGECLDSLVFDSGEHVISLGVRDQGWMLSDGVRRGLVPTRFLAADPWTGSDYTVSYERSGLRIEYGEMDTGEKLHCRLAVALAAPPGERGRPPPVDVVRCRCGAR